MQHQRKQSMKHVSRESEIHSPFQKLHGDIYNSQQQDQALNMEHVSTVFGNTKIITGGYKIVR